MHVAVVGGSDAGIEAARRIRELGPGVEVAVLVADAYPNLSICGLPCWHSRGVPEWSLLAHRSVDDLRATGMRLLLDHEVTTLDLAAKRLGFVHNGQSGDLGFDRLILGTGARPRPSTDRGDRAAEPGRRVHVLQTMPDAFALDTTIAHAVLDADATPTAAIVGAGYVGLEMAEALTARGVHVVVLEQLAQVLPRTLDTGPGLGGGEPPSRQRRGHPVRHRRTRHPCPSRRCGSTKAVGAEAGRGDVER